MKYTNIIFLYDYEEAAGINAGELIKKFDEGGIKEREEVFDYLMQWHTGEEFEHFLNCDTPWGKCDKTHAFNDGQFIISWNTGLGYISLHEILD